MQQPPELPPLKPIQPAQPDQPHMQMASAPSVQAKPAAMGTKRLRQMVAAVTGGGLALVAMICAGELVLREGMRPTDLMAMIEGRTERGVFNIKMGAEPGEVRFTEAEYQQALAKAQRQGQAEAELVLQKQLLIVQADKERVVAAYQTLYQRANMVAQAAFQLESMAQQMRAQLIQTTNGGRNVVIMVKDIFCGLGDPAACVSARQDRGTMIDEADELSRGDVGKRVSKLMAGIDDPASFVTREDTRRNGTPALKR